MVAHGEERLFVCDTESLAQDNGGDGAVEEDGVVPRIGIDLDADLAGEADLLGGRLGAKEVVPPDGELDALLVGNPEAGEGQCLIKDAPDVAHEPGGALQQLLTDDGNLGGDHPSWPRRRPPTRWRWRWWMVMPASSPTLKARR